MLQGDPELGIFIYFWPKYLDLGGHAPTRGIISLSMRIPSWVLRYLAKWLSNDPLGKVEKGDAPTGGYGALL